MTAFIQPLALQSLLVTTISGNMVLFSFLAFAFIAALAARFRMNNLVFGMIVVLFGVIMAAWMPVFYILSVILGGLIIGFIVAKLFKN